MQNSPSGLASDTGLAELTERAAPRARQPRDSGQKELPTTVAPMNVNRPGSSVPERNATPLLLNLATVGLIVAWLAFASYAIAYLISH